MPAEPAPPVAPTSPAPAEGFAKFRLGVELGRGGMGRVRSAKDVALHRELAIKSLMPNFSRAAVMQFVEEAQITGQLEHPNIVPIHELGLDRAGRPWLAMKRVMGTNLREWIADRHANINGRLDAEFIAETLGIFTKICDAIAFAHSRGVVHRDLKPQNIMVGAFGEVLVVDWGLAKPLTTPDTKPLANVNANARTVMSDRRLGENAGTVRGAVFGTPAYMAPEQATGNTDAIAEPTDIFALGGILYHLLTGKAPYAGADTADIVKAAANRELIAPRQRAPQRGIPRELAAIAMRAMASVPAHRYASVTALQADLTAYENHRCTVAYRAGLIERIGKWTRRHPILAMSGTLSLLFVAMLGFLTSLWLGEMERAQFEADRRAIAEKDAADRQVLLDALNAGDYENVLSLLRGKVFTGRNAAVDEFHRMFEAAAQNSDTNAEFWSRIDRARLAEFLDAFESLFAAHEKWNVPVTFNDYFEYAHLLSLCEERNDDAIIALTRALEFNPASDTAYEPVDFWLAGGRGVRVVLGIRAWGIGEGESGDGNGAAKARATARNLGGDGEHRQNASQPILSKTQPVAARGKIR